MVLKGQSNATRVVVKKGDGWRKNQVLAEGYGLKFWLSTDSVVGRKTKQNSIIEIKEVLGIKVAR